MVKKKRTKGQTAFNFTFRCIDDVTSFNNFKIGDFVYHIYPAELEIKDTTNTARCTSFLDIHIDIASAVL